MSNLVICFLAGGDSTSGRPGREGVAVCSQKRALCVTAIVLGTLLGKTAIYIEYIYAANNRNTLHFSATALVIAYAGPQTACPCAGKIPPGFVVEGYNSSEPFEPIATNGQPFPWLLPTLPNNVRPNRYMLTIHPNLTTMEVKGLLANSISFEIKIYHIAVLQVKSRLSSTLRRKLVSSYYTHKI